MFCDGGSDSDGGGGGGSEDLRGGGNNEPSGSNQNPRPDRSWWKTVFNVNSPSAPSASSAPSAASASSAQQQVTSDADLDVPTTDSDLKKSLSILLQPYKDGGSKKNIHSIGISYLNGKFYSKKPELEDIVNLLNMFEERNPEVFHKTRPSRTSISKILSLLDKK